MTQQHIGLMLVSILLYSCGCVANSPNMGPNMEYEPQMPAITFDEAGMAVMPSQGPCPTPPVVNDFQLNQYLGRWFEIERFFAPFQNGDCVTADYSLLPNCTVSVVNSNVVLGQLTSIYGVAVAGPDPSKGELIVNFPGQPGAPMFETKEPNYGVVMTDYSNYAVVYSCRNITPTRRFEYSWILGRREKVNAEFLNELKQWLAQVGIQVERYMPTNQMYCQRRMIHS